MSTFLRKRFPEARPNRLMLELADEVLGTRGEMGGGLGAGVRALARDRLVTMRLGLAVGMVPLLLAAACAPTPRRTPPTPMVCPSLGDPDAIARTPLLGTPQDAKASRDRLLSASHVVAFVGELERERDAVCEQAFRDFDELSEEHDVRGDDACARAFRAAMRALHRVRTDGPLLPPPERSHCWTPTDVALTCQAACLPGERAAGDTLVCVDWPPSDTGCLAYDAQLQSPCSLRCLLDVARSTSCVPAAWRTPPGTFRQLAWYAALSRARAATAAVSRRATVARRAAPVAQYFVQRTTRDECDLVWRAEAWSSGTSLEGLESLYAWFLPARAYAPGD